MDAYAVIGTIVLTIVVFTSGFMVGKKMKNVIMMQKIYEEAMTSYEKGMIDTATVIDKMISDFQIKNGTSLPLHMSNWKLMVEHAIETKRKEHKLNATHS